ncbi:primosomal protein DnaI [Alkalibacterium sp. AK22]|uniref:primosomal protein DnaI n=1 Tax=Alkalibacterium sp. AK22 TaxID=1229520 RepID=UPI000556085F|nr:primosomal protein DnaI [Alkalibacterium sp. AK22]
MDSIKDQLAKMMNTAELSDRFSQIMKNEVFKDPDVRQFLTENKDALDKEAIERSASKLYEFVSEKRKADTAESGLAPGYRPKLMLNNHRVDVTYVPTEDLIDRRKASRIRNRITSMYMPKDLKEASLEGFEATRKRQEAFEKAIRFIEAYLDNPKEFHKGLYFQGAFGVGKTYLLGAIAHELSEHGHASTLVHFPTFAVEMKNSIGNNTTESKLTTLKKARVLMIDDIGADSMSSWIRDDVLGVILQYRMQEELPTFFTSNFDMDQLEKEHLSVSQRGETEPLKAKRLMERIRFLSEEVTMAGENRRQNKS